MNRHSRRTKQTASASASASATLTITEAPSGEEAKNAPHDEGNVSGDTAGIGSTASLVLRLNSPDAEARHVHWTEETVDNEHLNRKKSNSTSFEGSRTCLIVLVCCIFHRSECECAEDGQSLPDLPPEGKNVYEYQPKHAK